MKLQLYHNDIITIIMNIFKSKSGFEITKQSKSKVSKSISLNLLEISIQKVFRVVE